MARKESDIIEQLADTICNYIVYNGSKAGKETALNDKTFPAVILGVNQKFTGNVSDTDKSNVINKYAIPESVEEGENSYYTFKINGVYYCKRQKGSFKLYDEIMVYIPNADWSRMYFDYADGSSHFENNGSGGDTAVLPELWVQPDAPGGNDMQVGDLWIVVNRDDITEFTDITTDDFVKIYKYYDNDKGVIGWHTFDCPVSPTIPWDYDEIQVGYMYIRTDAVDVTKFVSVKLCTDVQGHTSTWKDVYPEPDEGYEVNGTISVKKPMTVGDHWIDIDSEENINAEAFWEYVFDKETSEQKWVRLCYYASGDRPHLYSQTAEPAGIDVKVGDWWIKKSNEGVAQALYEYQVVSVATNEWVLLNTFANGSSSSGVGEWLDDGHTAERFNDYHLNTSNRKYDHIEGYNNQANVSVGNDFDFNGYNHLEGGFNKMQDSRPTSCVHVEGGSNTVSDCGYGVHVGGSNNTVSQAGAGTTVSGNGNTVTNCGTGVTVSGMNNSVTNGCEMSAVFGDTNTVSAFKKSIVNGYYNKCSGCDDSIVIGDSNEVKMLFSTVVSGQYIKNSYSIDDSVLSGRNHELTAATGAGIFGVGHTGTFSNAVVTGWYATDSSNYALIVGNGSENDPANTFTVTYQGITTASRYDTSGADYAEYFEWADGNSSGDDRCGMLVMLSGDKILPAHGDNILGAVSARASVVGNAYEEYWHGKYVTDVYGRSNGEISPEFDPDKTYIPRSQRPEWDVVGLIGRLIIRDDGSCKVGEFVSARRGIGTSCYHNTGVRVLKRIDETHIEVLIK